MILKYIPAKPHTRLFLIASFILLVGLGSSVLIYLTAPDESASVLGYEIIDGTAYPISPGDSKMYRHDLELYGGKANVVANEFTRWFEGLWHGRSLAFSVAAVTIVTFLGCVVVARHLFTVSKSGGAGGTDNPR